VVIVLARENIEARLRAIQTMTEQFQLCEWGHCRLGKLRCSSEITSASWDESDYQTCPHTPLQQFGHEG
jgi:hypothetical protein